MKILMIIETGGGGSGRHVLDLARGLVARGHELHLISSPRRAETAFLRKLEAIEGTKVVSVDIHQAVGPQDITAFWQLRRYLKAHGPFDIVHGHSSKGGVLGRLAATGTDAARIYTPHGLYTLNPVLSGLKKLAYGSIERLFARYFSDAVIAVSGKELEHALEQGFPKKVMHLVGNGVEPRDKRECQATRARVRARLAVDDATPVVGFVGRFCTAKAAERFVELARLTRGKGYDARFVLLGSGDGAVEIERLIAAYKLDGYLKVFPDESGEEFMPAFDIFTLTSRYEAMPYVLLEALAAGRPIIATDVGGSRTAIDDGVNGFVVPQQDDVSEMAGKLAVLLQNASLRQSMAAESLRRAENFTLDAMVEATIDVYHAARSEPVPRS